jgi:hypothetical protein
MGLLLVNHDPNVVAIVFQADGGSTAIVYSPSDASLINWPGRLTVDQRQYRVVDKKHGASVGRTM